MGSGSGARESLFSWKGSGQGGCAPDRSGTRRGRSQKAAVHAMPRAARASVHSGAGLVHEPGHGG